MFRKMIFKSKYFLPKFRKQTNHDLETVSVGYLLSIALSLSLTLSLLLSLSHSLSLLLSLYFKNFFGQADVINKCQYSYAEIWYSDWILQVFLTNQSASIQTFIQRKKERLINLGNNLMAKNNRNKIDENFIKKLKSQTADRGSHQRQIPIIFSQLFDKLTD